MVTVPSREAWGDLDRKIGIRDGYEMYGGKPVEAVLKLVADHPIEVAEGLMYAPPEVFNYYIVAFVRYLLSPESRGSSDTASVFLHIVRDRLDLDPSTFNTSAHEFREPVLAIAGRQTFYGASEAIYGSFQARATEILHALAKVDPK